MLHDFSSNCFKGRHIGCTARTSSPRFRRCVNRNDDNVGVTDAARNIRREEQVGLLNRLLILLGGGQSVSRHANHLSQTGLVDGGMSRVPSSDSVLVSVHHCDFDMWIFEGNDCGSRPSYIIVSIFISLRFI